MRQTVKGQGHGRSRVEFDIDYTLPGGILATVMDHLLLERANEHEAERSLQNLKHLVESTSE
jgi:uncharacterized membrane protein